MTPEQREQWRYTFAGQAMRRYGPNETVKIDVYVQIADALLECLADALDEVERLQKDLGGAKWALIAMVEESTKLRAIAEAAEKVSKSKYFNALSWDEINLLEKTLKAWKGEPGVDANGSPVD